MPQLTADSTFLTGTNATASFSFVHPSPLTVRSRTHIFQRTSDNYNSKFTEQLYLSPFDYQPADQCGSAVALSSDYYAMVGCPNRDDFVPNQWTGAAIFYNLSMLRLQFDDYTYNVSEGEILKMSVRGEGSAEVAGGDGSVSVGEDVLLYLRTLERNAAASTQLFVRRMYNILDSEIPEPSTAIDVTGLAGQAVGRSSYYGSDHNESAWIFGMYDYRAISGDS